MEGVDELILTNDAPPTPAVLRFISNAVRGRPVNERLETLGDAWLNYYAGFVVFQASRRWRFCPVASLVAPP